MAVKARATITLAAVKDIDSIYWFYKLQASTAAAPTKAGLTAAAIKGDPPTGWSDSEPTYTSGSTQTLYIVEQTYYTDGTNEFSEVSKSTSYEAAKAAWNKADNAETVAGSKAKTYRTEDNLPDPPYKAGDIWIRQRSYIYNLTEDEAVDSGKTYYERTGTSDDARIYEEEYAAVASPTTADISGYYERKSTVNVVTYVCVQAKTQGQSFAYTDWARSSTDDTANSELRTELNTSTNEIENIKLAVSGLTPLNGTVEEMQGLIAALAWEDYMNLYKSGNNPIVQLGVPEKVVDGYSLLITNSSMEFHQVLGSELIDEAIAFFGQIGHEQFGMKAQTIEAENGFMINENWLMEQRSNGNMAIKWIGGAV